MGENFQCRIAKVYSGDAFKKTIKIECESGDEAKRFADFLQEKERREQWGWYVVTPSYLGSLLAEEIGKPELAGYSKSFDVWNPDKDVDYVHESIEPHLVGG